MMNLSDIKGIIEINGESYDPKEVIKALVEQGLKIHPLNGSLLIGRTFIDPSPDLDLKSSSCPISDHCKIFEQLNTSKAELLDSSLSSYNIDLDPHSIPNQSTQNRFYSDPVQMNVNDMDIQSFFAESSLGDTRSRYNNNQQSSTRNSSLLDDLEPEPTEMMGVSHLTKYGRSNHIDTSNIPQKYRRKCPYCNSVVNINWKFCGTCGTHIQ